MSPHANRRCRQAPAASYPPPRLDHPAGSGRSRNPHAHAEAAPKAVVCLLSALSFHDIGTQFPHQVWIAVDRRSRAPALAWPRLRVLRFSGAALTEGIETHRIEGEQVRVYGVPKTLADVFKYRNKVGLDVALEALRESWRARRFTMDEMHR